MAATMLVITYDETKVQGDVKAIVEKALQDAGAKTHTLSDEDRAEIYSKIKDDEPTPRDLYVWLDVPTNSPAMTLTIAVVATSVQKARNKVSMYYVGTVANFCNNNDPNLVESVPDYYNFRLVEIEHRS